MALLSVVIPIYNGMPYLKKAIESVLNQTLDDIEIILVNDNSPQVEDEKICMKYVNKYGQMNNNKFSSCNTYMHVGGGNKRRYIKYIKHDVNKGAGAAKASGILHACGKYTTFVDSDDYLINNKVYEYGISKLENKENIKELEDIDIFMFNYTRDYDIGNNSNIINADNYEIFQTDRYNLIKTTASMWNKIFKTSQVKSIEINQNIKYDDGPFWIEYLLENKPKIYFQKDILYYYRDNGKSITGNPENHIHLVYALRECQKIIKSNMDKYDYIDLYFTTGINGGAVYNFFMLKDKKVAKEYMKEMREIILDDTIGIESISIGGKLFFKNFIFFTDLDRKNAVRKNIKFFILKKYLSKLAVFISKMKVKLKKNL